MIEHDLEISFLKESVMVLNSRTSISIFVILAFVFCPLGMCQQSGSFKELTLKITTTVQEVLPMEPMPITITLSNDTETPITGHIQIDPGYGILKIYVAKADKLFEQFHSADRPTLTGIRGENVLKPGFRTSVSVYLFYAHPPNLDKDKKGQYLFESPGVYYVKAIFEDLEGEKKIESNMLTIEVKRPSGEDTAAYEFLRNLKEKQEKDIYYRDFLLTTFGHSISPRDQKVLDKKEEFLSQFPNSRYARYVYYSLGDNYRLGVGKGVKQGIALLEKAASYEDFFLAKDVFLKLIKTLSDQGETDKAWEYKKIFARRFPDADEGRDYLEQTGAPEPRSRSNWFTPKALGLVSIAVAILAMVVVLLLFKYTPLFRRKT